MIKTMLKPFFKRYFGLFISMVFVSMLAVGLLCCFGSSIINTKKSYEDYLASHEDMDEQVTTQFTTREKILSISNLEGVDRVDARLTVDAFLKKETRTIVTRIFSYNEEQNTIFKRYVVKKTNPVDDEINISISQRFAKNNNFQLGQTIQIGFFNIYEKFHITEVVATPEDIYPRANNYIWSDNRDFGYIYASEVEISRGLDRLAHKILDEVANNPEYKEYYEMAKNVAGIVIPDLNIIDDNFASKFANQVLVKNQKNANNDEVLQRILTHYKDNDIKVKSSLTKSFLPYVAYMDNALRQIRIASIFLPVFFYSITMIVVGLFINQIIKSMTPQIGIMMSIGIDGKEIVGLFLVFTALMAITAGAIGAPVGFALNLLLSGIMKNTYSIPTISPALNFYVVFFSILSLIIFALVASLLSCIKIFRITPKDATISNEAKRKPLPKPIEKFIDKAPMNIKLGTNAIMQNLRRFLVSTFSIFASLVLILLSTLFAVSKDEMIDQSVNRRLQFDCQVYLTQKEEQSFIDEFSSQSFIKSFEDGYYTYLKVDNQKEDVYLECLALNAGDTKLVTIPNSKGTGKLSIKEEGIILPKSAAERLKVKVGDSITINNVSVNISDISYQYFHPITYLSKSQMDKFGVDYVSSFILNTNSDAELLNYLSENKNQCLTVFTSSLSKDLHDIFDAVNVMIYIMVGFSIGMAFIILAIMSQNALMEQQRQLTIFRAIGFTVFDISNVWTLQSVSQMVVSSIFAIPAGALSIYILLKLASSPSQTYPFIFSWPVVFMALGFVLLVVIATHLISMRSISRWNIADNTRSRE